MKPLFGTLRFMLPEVAKLVGCCIIVTRLVSACLCMDMANGDSCVAADDARSRRPHLF